MNRRTFYVTPAAGAYVAGRRVELLSPGPSGAVELELSEREAEHDLRIGALSETPPAKKRARTAAEASEVGSDVGGAETAPTAAKRAGTRRRKGSSDGRSGD